MKPHRAAAALIVLCLGWTVQVCGEEKQTTPADDWYRAFKDIQLGPGKLDIGMSLRLRYEFYRNMDVRHYYGMGREHDLLLERYRINFDYRLSPNMHFFFEGQDSHFWLSDLQADDFGGTCPLQNAMDLRQGFFEWRHIGESPWGFKVGRQVMDYGDQHVFSPGDWGNVGRYWWDGTKIYFDTEAFSVDAFAFKRVYTEPYTFDETHYDYDLFGVYAQFKKLPAKLDLFYTLYDDDHKSTAGESGTGDRETHTVGGYVDGKLGKNWDYRGTLAYQFGNWGHDDISAWGGDARFGYTFDLPWSPRVGLEYSFASGDRSPTDGKHGTFDGLFGTTEAYYGRMNLFGWMNLRDYEASFSVKPTKNVDVSLDYHFFQLDAAKDAWYHCTGKAERRDATGKSGSDVGQEIDLVAKWKVNKNVEVQAGYGHFFPGDFIRHTAGGHASADWAFMQFLYSF